MPVGAVVGAVGAAAIGANAQAKAAKKSAQAISDAADQSTAVQREIYYDQRNLLTPSMKSGAIANARRMLMQGYSRDEVKAYLKSVDSAIGSGTVGDGTGASGGAYFDGFGGNASTLTNQGGDLTPTPSGDSYDWVDNWNWQSSSPSYQFRMDEGQKALERSKAASGDYFSGDTAKALTKFGQDFASQEFEADWRRLGELAGEGSDATGTTVNVAGNYGQQAGNNIMTAGNARASGYRQAGNALGNFWQGAAGIPMYAAGQGWWGK